MYDKVERAFPFGSAFQVVIIIKNFGRTPAANVRVSYADAETATDSLFANMKPVVGSGILAPDQWYTVALDTAGKRIVGGGIITYTLYSGGEGTTQFCLERLDVGSVPVWRPVDGFNKYS